MPFDNVSRFGRRKNIETVEDLIPQEKFDILFSLIKKRGSVRKYSKKRVSDELILKILESARNAPSAGNHQPWEFIVVRNRDIKSDLVEAAYYQEWMLTAPVFIVACINMRLAGAVFGERGLKLYGSQDVAAAIENMLLAAEALGLGTCLPRDTEIILDDGSILKIDDFVNSNNPHPKDNEKILSVNGFSNSYQNILACQKLPSPKELIKIKTKSGTELTLTPDHKILVDLIDGPKLIRADEIKDGNRIYELRKIDITSPEEVLIIELLPEDFVVYLNKDFISELKQRIFKKFRSYREVAEKLKIPYYRFKEPKKFRIKELKLISQEFNFSLKYIARNINKFSKKDTKYNTMSEYSLTPELMYAFGLISSDGNIDSHKITFKNKNIELIKSIEKIFKNTFPKSKVSLKVRPDSYEVSITNFILSALVRSLGLKSISKVKDIKPIFKLNEKLIATFLRGYFDGDGSCSLKYLGKKGHSISVKIASVDNLTARRIRLLLKRLGIASSLHSWTPSSKSSFSENTMYEVSITNKFDILNFIKIVGSNHPRKSVILENIRDFYSKVKERASMFALAPLSTGRLIKKIRKKYSLKAREVAPYKEYLLNRERTIGRSSKDVFRRILFKLKNVIKEDEDVKLLEELLSTDFFLDPVIKIEKVKSENEFVYDVTVDRTHLFVPNGDIIVSNCWVGSFSEVMVARILQCPDYVRPCAIITLGYPAEEPYRPLLQSLEEFSHLERFGETLQLEKVKKEKKPTYIKLQ